MIKNAIYSQYTASTREMSVVKALNAIFERSINFRFSKYSSKHGKVVESGNLSEVIKEPKEEYTRQLLSVRTFRKAVDINDDDCNVILQVKNVSASYTGKEMVLEDINVQIRHGKTVALVGESGSGKSTLARVITGLLPPLRGKIIYEGKELPPALKSRDRESLRVMQMIYQMPDTALNPKHKVRKILARPLQFYFGMDSKKRKNRIVELLEMIELSKKYMDRFPDELSGGEKQRICIARALAANPKLIICDEVTSALDQLVAEEILKLLP